jgi:hypothetical protein
LTRAARGPNDVVSSILSILRFWPWLFDAMDAMDAMAGDRLRIFCPSSREENDDD